MKSSPVDGASHGASYGASSTATPSAVSAIVDVGSAIAASMAVSPFILTIDKAIVESAAGRTTLLKGIVDGVTAAVRRPHSTLLASPAYWMVTGVYAVTYAAANMIDTHAQRTNMSSVLHGTSKLVGTTAVNTSACIAKDVAFARMFGASSSSAKPMPIATVGLFGARDLLTIASAFTVPPLLATALESCAGLEARRAEDAAQVVSPICMQVVCAPLHLLALNLYNAPVATVRQRAAEVARMTPQTTLAYMARMAPAFGIGGVMNATLTRAGHEALTAKYQGISSAIENGMPPPAVLVPQALSRTLSQSG